MRRLLSGGIGAVLSLRAGGIGVLRRGHCARCKVDEGCANDCETMSTSILHADTPLIYIIQCEREKLVGFPGEIFSWFFPLANSPDADGPPTHFDIPLH